ncbi:MAG TPA: quinate 5-dehydrogenase [Promineifilum sp.]|nr:quinate 5-dehydrogenase [Promineifilum sp.]
MKRAVSISLGSSKRNNAVELDLLGERVRIERIGTDGDMEQAARLFGELDGQVDAFGVGGADLGLMVGDKRYLLHSVKPMVRLVKHTPLVDGSGLKNTLERGVAPYMDAQIGSPQPRRVLMTSGADRWGMSMSFLDSGYEGVFGDLMFGLGLPVPLRSAAAIIRVTALLLPVVTRLPFEWLYPTGEKQETNTPKFGRWYEWASVIAGDCHFVKRFMPARLDGKIICTNTTTSEDVATFRAAGVSHLVTTTPRLEGRSFGTNMMEAMLVAVSGKGRPLTDSELEKLIARLELRPHIERLNE